MHASPANAWIGSLVLFAFMVLFVAGLGVWFEIVRRQRRGIPVVAYEPRRPVPWTAAEIVLILAGYLMLQVAAAQLVFQLAGLDTHHATELEADAEPQEMDPRRYTAMLLGNALGNVLTAAATIGLLRGRRAPVCR